MNLIIFLGCTLLLAAVITTVTKGRKEKRAQIFNDFMVKTMTKTVPQAAGFQVVMAQGSQDALSFLKDTGKEFLTRAGISLLVGGQSQNIQTTYKTPPSFMIGYQNNEMYVLCVGEHPSFTSLQPDPNFILHLTPDNLQKISFGIGGKITFLLKEGNTSFIITVTNFAVSMLQQPKNCKEFHAYIKDFASKHHLQ